MRALLHDGAATAPPSVAWAKRRLADLEFEIAKINRQLDDPNRGIRARYAEWKRKAEKALGLLTQEATSRREWLEDEGDRMAERATDEWDAFWREP